MKVKEIVQQTISSILLVALGLFGIWSIKLLLIAIWS